MVGIENTHQHRDGAGKDKIRQHQPRHFDGERQAWLIPAETGRQRDHQKGHRQRQHARDAQQYDCEGADQLAGISAGTFLAAFIAPPQIERHESRIQRALGEEPPHQIGKLKRDDEGIGARAGTEQSGNRHIAYEAEDTRRQRRRADNRDISGDGHKKVIPVAGLRLRRIVLYRSTGSRNRMQGGPISAAIRGLAPVLAPICRR
jgi:hypothetical protein